MSGGSFDYVYRDMEDPERARSATSQLERMKEYCSLYFSDAVPHIDDMLQFIYRFNSEYVEKGARIADLLHAVEWERSCDWGPEDVEEALQALKVSDDKPKG